MKDMDMMARSLLIRGCFPGATEAVDLDIRDGRLHAVLRAGNRTPDLGDGSALLAPGLFDIQVNGAWGLDVQSETLSPELLHTLDARLNACGVMHWMPTLVTDSAEALEHKCHILGGALQDALLARHIPGIHLEGPHISPEDGPRGAHPAAHVCPPDLKLFDRLQRAAGGRIRYVTLAPELPGALPFIRALVAQGVVAALGHHAADAGQIRAAADAGARLCTHLGNGMASKIHRHQNPLWPQLADDRLYASVIADLEHVPPEMLGDAACQGRPAHRPGLGQRVADRHETRAVYHVRRRGGNETKRAGLPCRHRPAGGQQSDAARSGAEYGPRYGDDPRPGLWRGVLDAGPSHGRADAPVAAAPGPPR